VLDHACSKTSACSYLVDEGAPPMTLNVALTCLRLFFDVRLERLELMARMQAVANQRPAVAGQVSHNANHFPSFVAKPRMTGRDWFESGAFRIGTTSTGSGGWRIFLKSFSSQRWAFGRCTHSNRRGQITGKALLVFQFSVRAQHFFRLLRDLSNLTNLPKLTIRGRLSVTAPCSLVRGDA
jgi:hypothetical protein